MLISNTHVYEAHYINYSHLLCGRLIHHHVRARGWATLCSSGRDDDDTGSLYGRFIFLKLKFPLHGVKVLLGARRAMLAQEIPLILDAASHALVQTCVCVRASMALLTFTNVFH